MTGVAPDGSPVELYLRLPGAAEAELVASVLTPRATILELGCGAGRVTDELVARGFAVTAVDESPEMLEHVRGAETVRSRIESLELGRRFECVVLASHFVNVPSERERTALLRACERHVADDGVVLAEAYPQDMAWTAGSATRVGDVTIRVAAAEVDGTRLRAAMEYEVGERLWRQPFEAELLDEDGLREALRAAGLAWERWLDEPRGWFAARRG